MKLRLHGAHFQVTASSHRASKVRHYQTNPAGSPGCDLRSAPSAQLHQLHIAAPAVTTPLAFRAHPPPLVLAHRAQTFVSPILFAACCHLPVPCDAGCGHSSHLPELCPTAPDSQSPGLGQQPVDSCSVRSHQPGRDASGPGFNHAGAVPLPIKENCKPK